MRDEFFWSFKLEFLSAIQHDALTLLSVNPLIHFEFRYCVAVKHSRIPL